MIKPIVLYGNKILREKCKPYNIGTDIKELIADMKDTLKNAEGVGLSAPQIGELTKLFIVDIPETGLKQTFINPIINREFGNEVTFNEGCLSIPGMEAPVKRKEFIDIEFYDEWWTINKMEFDGLDARVIQHEYDHLQGILWLDRIDIKYTLSMITALKHCQLRKVNNVNYPYI